MTEGEKILVRMLEHFLDEHPNKEFITYLHIVDGQWKHKVEIKDVIRKNK